MYPAAVQGQFTGIVPELDQRLWADPGYTFGFWVCVQRSITDAGKLMELQYVKSVPG
jgi:hypothetical protein